MTKLTLASYPHMLGFEQLERVLERSAKAGNEGYPPFNIEQTSDYSYRITLAVAGFSEQDLSITVEDRQLVIRGRQSDDGEDRVFLHRGIAARQFQRSFVRSRRGNIMQDAITHGNDRMVYVKTIAVADLPREVRDQAEGLELLYAVHDAEGQQLALVGDQKLAFSLAREHDYRPVMVH